MKLPWDRQPYERPFTDPTSQRHPLRATDDSLATGYATTAQVTTRQWDTIALSAYSDSAVTGHAGWSDGRCTSQTS